MAGIVWSLRAFNGWADAVVLLPMAALGIGAAAAAVAVRLPHRIAVRVVAVWTTCDPGRGVRRVRWPPATTGSSRERTLVADVLATGPEDATLMSIGAPQPLVLSHRTNPVQHQNFLAGLSELRRRHLPRRARRVRGLHRAGAADVLTFDNPRYYPWLTEMRERDYTGIGRTSGYLWFVRNDVGDGHDRPAPGGHPTVPRRRRSEERDEAVEMIPA